MTTNPLRRGGAAVELAVLCLILVPLIMYTLFLAELFVMKLNGQEAAVQAPWDFTLVDYSNPERPVDHDGAVAQQSRLTYCDHSSAYNSYNISSDCADTAHHASMTAHECWSTRPGQAVMCSLVDQPVTGRGAGIEVISESFPSGGVVECSAQLGVMNYYLPNKFLENFTTVQMTEKRRMQSRWAGGSGFGGSEDAHGDARSNTGSTRNFWSLGRTEIRMMTDTWAVTHMYSGAKGIESIDQNDLDGYRDAMRSPMVGATPSQTGDHPVYDRLAHMYWRVNDQGLFHSNRWHATVKFLLHSDSQEDKKSQVARNKRPLRGNGDHMSSLSVRFEQDVNDQMGPPSQQDGTHYAAGWGDTRNRAPRGSDYWQAMDPNGRR
jgi:hypothetical protein